MKKLILYILIFVPFFASAQSVGTIKYFTEKLPNSFELYAENLELMPMSASLVFTLDNMKSSLANNQIVVIPAQTKRFLVAKLTPIIANKKFGYSTSSKYTFGDITQTSYDENYVYDLPFDSNKSYSIFQGYNGKISHMNQAALDFNFKVGEKIFAAREGKVVATEERNNTNCNSKDCAKYNNYILILQPDGTFAEYLHLKQNGVEVNVGDEIKKGQFLGYSGNTGWSTGPHLHFAVFLNRMDKDREFIKTKFRTSNSTGEYLLEKKSYLKNY
ncbi:M23 family metallopeptidase [Halpernia frigidisoli]|uniref:Murein DD-endopeptidase MepM and murein hydrolase activator NlpD, contain LysM domain n=1 Tax=Halpernia frigidisoli TaxID=1125876 RepID=A0A1I3D7Q3_9FLAO|nr:M23 family metallopeptidase [Halpernia frigidisoli]SFH82745.1 Murein DD-endopeptidase MepM and murein hydrolase activator NlpD, contain LysM domain [Halpernia frigidisoli]